MKLADLPHVVPVFPLAAPLLLPGTVVPFYAAEPQYHRLLEDALAEKGYVGIIQPVQAEAEIGQPGEAGAPLFSVGCLGHIGEFREEDPGSFLVLAGGLIRFRVLEEMPSDRGYRLAVVDYSEFEGDLAQAEALEFPALKDLVRKRIESNQSVLDLSIMEGMAGTEIVTAIAHAINFSSAERQVLMETPNLPALEQVLLQLMAGPGGVPSFDLQLSAPS